LGLKDIKSVYKTFLPLHKDQLLSATPTVIKDIQFLHELELYYSPAPFPIRGEVWKSSFRLKGQAVFQNLLVTVHIFFDPQSLNNVVFSYALPSFTLAHQNVKFLSPMEFLQEVPKDLESLMRTMGPPTIEIEVPTNGKGQNVEYELKGIFSAFSIKDYGIAKIKGNQLTMGIKGKMFEGVFNSSLDLVAYLDNSQPGRVKGNITLDNRVRELE